jgi:hypothetical protein
LDGRYGGTYSLDQSLFLKSGTGERRRFADPHDDPAILACREKQLTLVL